MEAESLSVLQEQGLQINTLRAALLSCRPLRGLGPAEPGPPGTKKLHPGRCFCNNGGGSGGSKGNRLQGFGEVRDQVDVEAGPSRVQEKAELQRLVQLHGEETSRTGGPARLGIRFCCPGWPSPEWALLRTGIESCRLHAGLQPPAVKTRGWRPGVGSGASGRRQGPPPTPAAQAFPRGRVSPADLTWPCPGEPCFSS